MSVVDPVIDHLDPALKRIFLAAGVTEYHPVTDLYAEVRSLRRLDDTLHWFQMPVTAAGNVPKGGGKFTSRYAVFCHGWKVVPQDVTHALYISGEQITDEGEAGPACLDTSILSSGTNVTIHYEPPASELVRADTELAAISVAVQAIQAKTDGLPSGIQRGQPLAGFCFAMLLNGQPVPGLTVAGERVGTTANAPLAHAVSERRNGVYVVDLTGVELVDPANTFRFTAAGADPQIITVVTSG